MKSLLISPYVSFDKEPKYRICKSGFGYMVYDIANSLREGGIEISLFTPYVFCPCDSIGGVNLLPWTWLSFLRQFRFRYLWEGVRFLKHHKSSFKDSLRSLFFFSCKHYISRIAPQYDIIHLHGLSALTIAAMQVLDDMGVKYLVTLHGLLSFKDAVRAPSWLKNYEREFLVDSLNTGRHVSFVSSGDMETASAFLNTDGTPPSFYVVPNGCDVSRKPASMDVRKRYGIPEDVFLFVFAGNISKWKNQVAVLDAFRHLSSDDRAGIKVLFCGEDLDGGRFKSLVYESGLSDSLIIAGGVPRSLIHNYYIAANATILTSLSEGFGLSIIEGLVYGKPCLVYKDLPAIADIGDDSVMLYPSDRSAESLVAAMLEMKDRSWDAGQIMEYARNFSLEKMAGKYESVYERILI